MPQGSPPGNDAFQRRRVGFVFALVLFAAFLLRVIGIDWGLPDLPDQVGVGNPPFHPDESAVFTRGQTLYSNPDAVTFGWGGALYFRLSYLLGALANRLNAVFGGSEFATTLLLLRGFNVILATATVAIVGELGRRTYGPAVGLTAAALLASFPNHVLSSHYARPDILMTFLSCAALASATCFATRGDVRFIVLGSVLAGLAMATSSWGVIALAPLGGAWAVRLQMTGRDTNRRLAFTSVLSIALGTAAGYGMGSFETFLFPDAFMAAFRRTAGLHDAGGFHPTLRHLVAVPLYAFGTCAMLCGIAGFGILLRRRRPVDWLLLATLIAGFVIITRMRGPMIRHFSFLAPTVALAAAVAIIEFSRWLPVRSLRPSRRDLLFASLVVGLTLQLSVTYVWAMGFREDLRFEVGRWLVENAPAKSKIAFTQSFPGDQTYCPRLPPGHDLRVERFMLASTRDYSDELTQGYRFIVTSDFATRNAPGSAFLNELWGRGQYRLRLTAAPISPPVFVAPWFDDDAPGDLMYVRSTFYVYRLEPSRTGVGVRGALQRAHSAGGIVSDRLSESLAAIALARI